MSTYRIQLNSSFKFSNLKNIIDYLHKLGITMIYGAPFFEARKGSLHGYDAVNPQLINPEIGTLAEFVEIILMLRERNMKWIQDIVPNHMAYDSNNAWLMDIFEKGEHSDYYTFFDIDWNHSDPDLKGKVLAPFLGKPLEEVISDQEIKLEFNQRGFFINYYALQYPICWSSYGDVLSFAKEFFENGIASPEVLSEVKHLIENFRSIKLNFQDSFEAENITYYKERFFQNYAAVVDVKDSLDKAILDINQNPDQLKQILDLQFYKLAYWRTTESKINYRRFFTVNDLICLNIDQEEVFNQYHQFTKTLLDEKLIDGLRIDHIDGLSNPTNYLERLRNLVGDEVYIIVEKILESEEDLEEWPVQGTSGYEFLSFTNNLFTNNNNKAQLTEIYNDFIDYTYIYKDLVFEKKLFILEKNMGGELDNLLVMVNDILREGSLVNRDVLEYQNLKQALATFLSAFPIYRIYSTTYPVEERELTPFVATFNQARQRKPNLETEFTLLEDIFYGVESDSSKLEELKHKFVRRSQQYTGPLAAKGVEDTVFYIYNRLISHNEVGDSPHLFGIEVDLFHQKMESRCEKHPLSLNATSTHDTKRGEDARMRINVLSELPDEWTSAVFHWKEINQKYKLTTAKGQFPDANTEYFIYQTLIGGFPMDGAIEETFITRVQDYLMKVVREAKVYTDWSNPEEEFENTTSRFIESVLKDNEFLESFHLLFEKVKSFGILYSLAQTVVKVTAPGIPDIYQGSELWDLSFVDPDNRRAVDYDLRQKFLNGIIPQESQNQNAVLDELIHNKEDGRIKLFTLFETLNLRNKYKEVFMKGEYVPLSFTGERADNLVGYARRLNDVWILVIIPRNLAAISNEVPFRTGEKIWENTNLIIPGIAPENWTNVFDKNVHKCLQMERPVPINQYVSNEINLTQFSEMPVIIEEILLLKDILAHFPIAVLVGF